MLQEARAERRRVRIPNIAALDASQLRAKVIGAGVSIAQRELQFADQPLLKTYT
jgi:hypothetical protein